MGGKGGRGRYGGDMGAVGATWGPRWGAVPEVEGNGPKAVSYPVYVLVTK